MSESGESAPQPAPRSDAELIRAIASGDAAAYVTLHERHMPAARNLASKLLKDPAEAEEVLSETFARLHSVLRRGGGPEEALRPYLLSAVRRVAYERQSSEREATPPGDEEIPDLGEPLLTDPATAELESTPLARAFMSLPERQCAVLWHALIEQGDPADAAALLGVTADGVAELVGQARAAFNRAYMALYLSDAREGCKAEAAKLDLHLDGATRGPDDAMVQRHLRSCRDCRAAAIELADLSRSLRRGVAPIFLGPAAQAYLAAAAAKPAPHARAIPGVITWLRSLSTAPRQVGQASRQVGQASHRIGQVPRRIGQAPRQRQALAGGVLLLAAFAVAGLSLTLAANGSPQHTARHPAPAAIGPPSPAASVPSTSRTPAPARPVSTTRPDKPAGSPSPAPAKPSPSAPATPAPTSPAPASPSPTPTPVPQPSPSPHRRHRHPLGAT